MRIGSVTIAMMVLLPVMVFGGGAAETGSADRGEYLAEQGQVVPPGEIHIDSYISRIDYDLN